MRTLTLIVGLWIAGMWTLSAQSITLSGRVVDENAAPLAGAQVLLRGTPQGALTDGEGAFSVAVSPPQQDTGTLVISFLGYESQALRTRGRQQFDVQLVPAGIELEGVTMTAIGIRREKRRLGYAATEVDREELQRSNEVSLANALNAKVAGVQVTSTSGSPGASTTIRIRGNKSINGDNAPLFVIDGVPVDNTYRGSNFTDQANRILDINPDDIASMTILKGGAATALYGVRAANGAVIITTKRGAAGETKVTFTTSIMADQVNKLPQKQTRYGQGELGGYVQGSRLSWGPRLDTMSYNGDLSDPFHRFGGLVSANDPSATGQAAEVYDQARDLFQTGLTNNAYLSLEGGSEQHSVFFSVGNTLQRGIVPNTRYRRTGVKLTGRTQVGDRIQVMGSVNYIQSEADRGQRGSNLSGVMLGLMRSPVSYDLTNGSSDPVNDPAAYEFSDGTQRTFHAAYDNPYWSVNRNRNRTNLDRMVGLTEVKIKLSEHLNLLERISLDYYSDRLKSHWDGGSNEYKDLGGRIFNQEVTQRNLNNDLVLTYDQRFGEDWDLTLTAGNQFTDYRTTILETDGFGFIVPGFYDISNTSIINAFADDFLLRERGVGLYGDVNVGWRRLLYLNLNGRNDWLSNLPPDNNSFFYNSASLGFVFTELIGEQQVNYGKLRLSYAQTGNGAPAPYLTSNFFVQNGTSVQGLVSYLPNGTIGNNQLRPENTTTYEVGTDLRFLQNRLKVDLTGYFTSTVDQIIEVPTATSSGYSTVVTNAGEITNQGIELLVEYDVLRSEKGLNWETSVNFTRNVSNVVALTDEIDNISLPSFGVASTQSRVIVGQQYGVIFGTRWLRDDAGQVIVDANGFPVRDQENGVVGDPNPDFTAGWRNTLRWRNLSLTFLWDVRVGGDMYNGTVGVMRFHGTHISTENREEEFVFDGVVQGTGEVNTTPISLNDYYTRYGLTFVSEENIETVNWLRLRDLTLTYELPSRLKERMPVLRGASVSAITRNLLLFTNFTGIDPETSLSGAANSFGREYFNNPGTRSFGFRLNLQF